MGLPLPDTNPIRGTFAGCCAWAGKLRAMSKALRARSKIFFVIEIYLPFMLTIDL